MAVETKPLFSPEVVRQYLHGFTPSESVASARARLQHWAELIASGKADSFKETALLPDFITDIFGHLLGYTGPAGSGGLKKVFSFESPAGLGIGDIGRGVAVNKWITE